ncbi:hypothetical protein GCM10007424_27500 [Flavobacterium suaedae]|uniref:DUF6265 domain-containing protein n=1 Tax=Flavobacterium suaedae TaxID=1767027 RepID=A0ABQ1K6D8_9FLAO|nr:DUF6265 family protein [Flavobacterium suaedae]GGB85939.1 hypothetical protein GCM10007424_27500 [Flavobacterium suaedae]
MSCKEGEEKKEETEKLLSEEKTTEKYDQIKEFDWLVGHWEGHSSENETTEVWEKQNDSTFTGYSFILSPNKDTIMSEEMILDQRGDSLHLVINARNQNNDKPVAFTLTGFAANKYIFENPDHDFPTRIIYNKIAEDSLLAEISGQNEGRTTIIEFPMVKKKE